MNTKINALPPLMTTAGFLVLNPVAGEGKPEKVKAVLATIFEDVPHDLYETTGDESLSGVVQTAVTIGHYKWVAVVGGDGTVSQVANGLVDTDVPLLIIPAGTGNVLAQALGIPQELEAASRLITSPFDLRRIDGIQLGDRIYFLQVGVGLEALTMQETSSKQKNRWGLPGYIWTAVKEAFGWQPHQFTLTVDGQRFTMRASELVIANAGDIGVLGLKWAKSIEPDDGWLDIIIVRARSLMDYAHVLWALLRGQQRNSEHIWVLRAQAKIELESARPVPLHGDGEIVETASPLQATIVPHALSVIVPK